MTPRSPGRSPSTRAVEPTLYSGTKTTTTTGRRVSSTRMLRLSRALSVLAEHEALRDRDQDSDPWPDIPEELDPVDHEATDDADFFYAAKRRRRPAIAYSRASLWPAPANASPADPFAIEGDLRVTIHRPLAGDSDSSASDLVADELQRIAAALDQLQSRALRASSRPEAFECLEPMSEKTLAQRAAVSPSVLARRRREIVEAPWGLAPLEFYWWKRERGLDLIEGRQLARVLWSEPDLGDRAVARRVAEQTAAPAEVAHRIDAIRKQVPIMRSLLPLLPTLSLLSRALTEVDLEELDDLIGEALNSESGHTLDKRGRGLVRLGLVGAFDD
jgi:hypothetical protein